MGDPRSVTLSAVAKRAGVHPSTVSKALRNHPRLKASTRERLQALAAEMGYQPDPQLAVLNAYRHRHRKVRRDTIALLHPPAPVHPDEAKPVKDDFWADALASADSLGYAVDRFDLNDGELRPARLHQILRARGIRGVIVSARTATHFRLELPWEHYSALVVGLHLEYPRLDTVVTDHFRNTQRAFLNLWERGFRRIGLVSDERGEILTQRRRIGAFLAESMATANPVPPFHGDLQDPAQLRQWFEQHQPDALLSSDLDAKQALEAAGLRFPEDAALALLNLRREGIGRAAGIQQNNRKATCTAVELLVSALHHMRCGIPRHQHFHIIEGSWHEGPTVPSKA